MEKTKYDGKNKNCKGAFYEKKSIIKTYRICFIWSVLIRSAKG
jgi:hypothetical protein